jgi:4-hydroxybenzoate polyprenyltransferase
MPIFDLTATYILGVLVASALMVYEHSLIRPDDLSKLDMAFFNMNGYISITIFVFTMINYLIPR